MVSQLGRIAEGSEMPVQLLAREGSLYPPFRTQASSEIAHQADLCGSIGPLVDITRNQLIANPLIPHFIAEVEQLEKMVQDILVVCVLPSADQDRFPSACLGRTGLAAGSRISQA